MKNELKPAGYKRCAAMIDKGIEDPNGQEGIDFCVECCPYPDYCVAVEEPISVTRTADRVKWAKRLRSKKISIDDIALIMGIPRRTLFRYLSTPDGLRGASRLPVKERKSGGDQL